MKQVVLPNRELRLLSGQLQSYNQGYTVEQIRSLDKVARIMEFNLKPYMTELNKVLEKIKKEKDEAKKEKLAKDFAEKHDEEKVLSRFEDVDVEFIKAVWKSMAGLSGQPEARQSILIIDEALKNATDPVFE